MDVWSGVVSESDSILNESVLNLKSEILDDLLLKIKIL
jgi:hypothetical protein